MEWGPIPQLQARLAALLLLVALPALGVIGWAKGGWDVGAATFLAVLLAAVAAERVLRAPLRVMSDAGAAARRAAEEERMARAAAVAANAAKAEFVSRLSHELRTPLNAILGFAQLLEMEALAPEQREYISQILKGGRHLLDLVREALDFARLEVGQMTISPEPVDVKEVLSESAGLVAPLAAAAGLWMAEEWAAGPERFVRADRQRLKQVLLNLLSNAVKYNRSGGTVTLSCRGNGAGLMRIAVTDTGPGIAPDRLERLFVPFDRLGAEGGEVEGTGLGLALSRRLVELMGGTLGVDSQAGRGSTFWVELPRTEGPLEWLARTTPGPAETEGTAAPERIQTVLYVEDNLSGFRLVQRLLSRHPGVRLLPAIKGRLALDLAREHHPDLIILDLHLPDLPGVELLRALRADPQTSAIPVLVTSADVTPSRRDEVLRGGASAYLSKPFDVTTFLRLVDEALGNV